MIRLLPGMLVLALAVTVAADEPKVRLNPIDPAGLNKVIAQHKGKVVLVDFWATWCGPCTEKLPKIVALASQHGDKKLAVVTVSMDEPDEDSKAKALEVLTAAKATASHNYLNTDPDWGYDIDGDALPHYRIYNRQGQLATKLYFDPDGKAPSPDRLEEELQAVLAQE